MEWTWISTIMIFISLWIFFRIKLFREKKILQKMLTILSIMPSLQTKPKQQCKSCLAATAKSLQSCPTLCDPIPGIITLKLRHILPPQRELQWNFQVLYVCCDFSCVWLLETQWTVARQAPLSMGFSRQEFWSGLSFPSPKMEVLNLK